MAKNKRGAGSRFKGPRPRRNGVSSGNQSGEYSGKNSLSRAHGYTLAEEARNTASNRRGAFGRDAQLRYKPVSFVSAGFMEPLKDLDVQLTTTEEVQGDAETVEKSPADGIPTRTDANSPKDRVPSSIPSAASPPELLVLDNPEAKTAAKPEHFSGQGSDDGCDSGEEIILFKGRDRNRQEPVATKIDQGHDNADSLEFREMDLELRVVEETLHQETVAPEAVAKPDDHIPLQSKPKRRRRQRKNYRNDTSDEDAAIIADYMANIAREGGDEDEDGEKSEHLGMGSHTFSILRDLGGTDSDAVPDDASSEEGMDDGSGPEDEPDSEAQQRQLEAEDERMARMLAKQEELGLGSDDVLLFDGRGSDDEWLTAPNAAPRRKRKGDSKKAKMFQKKGQYPNATKMADAFDELDLMDWHRPSLNNFKKGLPAFDVSDSELEEAMKSTWKKDRLKKAEKKKTREELRSQGLLGKNVNPDDLRIKYLGGMSLDDLANELEAFLLGSQEQLVLPPFDKNARKTIHALANKFKIKSQSAGKGTDRNPVLYRTKATLPFDQPTFDSTLGRIKQTWFPRVDADDEVVNKTRVLKRADARSGKSRFKNSMTYRDGDIVGQHAAELGAENKGRAMLEKMGWSKGMALGSGENKGIMVPITHVVKKTKAGLGDA
ncbi:hypothetical protein F4818DRAFT_98870 [Hypoxylon cercidicola]|nr:hypothetical protein F4818DRAFT_98870 [Hypoxylon cercidicola]